MNKILETITKLIDWTKDDKIQWNKLSGNLSYLDQIKTRKKKVGFNSNINLDHSFYSYINKGAFIIHTETNGDLPETIYLSIVPNQATFPLEFETINEDTSYQSELLRVLNLIIEKYPTVDSFIDDFLNL